MTADRDPLERAARMYRQRLGEAPHGVTDAATHAFRDVHAREARTGWDPARVLVALAGLSGLLLDSVVLLGGTAHSRQDVAALHVALCIGFVIAAWRPQRYARGLAPVAAAAALLLLLPTLGDTSAVTESAAQELSHLPIVTGAAALLLARWHDGVEVAHRDARRR